MGRDMQEAEPGSVLAETRGSELSTSGRDGRRPEDAGGVIAAVTASTSSGFTVGAIEKLLFEVFPASDAVPDDRFGLLVGDRAAAVERIALALDADVATIRAAASAGCQLLVTHHPAFWFAPVDFTAADTAGIADGAAVFAAAAVGVALLNLHTCVDTSPLAASLLLEPVGLRVSGPLRPVGKGSLGWLAHPETVSGSIQLFDLASAYQRAFGRVAKVWGDPGRTLARIAVCSGGAGEVLPDLLALDPLPDCFVTGELRHHEALYVVGAGISLIELGHDTSELPYRQLLAEALVQAGFAADALVILEPPANWWVPVPPRQREAWNA